MSITPQKQMKTQRGWVTVSQSKAGLLILASIYAPEAELDFELLCRKQNMEQVTPDSIKRYCARTAWRWKTSEG